MTYADVKPGVFLARPNRFIAQVQVDGRTETCHVKNTGRLGELLLPGTPAFVAAAQNPARKTRWDLIAVEKGGALVNIDSAAPNKVFAEWLRHSGHLPGLAEIKPEVAWGSSRFDFRLTTPQGATYAEVKGVTLEADGLALFPDAPTQRGVRHIEELCRCMDEGHGALLAFIIQMRGPRAFAPNDTTHPAFGAALRRAAAAGVQVLALDCDVTENSITARDFVPVLL